MSHSEGSGSVAERLERLSGAFLPSSPVHRQELLAGRQEQLFSLLETSQTPGGHAAIFGERGAGKTSVAAVFESDLASRGVRVSRINCAAISNFRSLIADTIKEWQSAYPELASSEDLSWLIGSAIEQSDVVRVFTKLAKDHKLVAIFDEFDTVADANVGEDFANLMKALSDKGADVHLVVVGVAENVDLILKGHASMARGLNQVSMPRLGDEELRKILDLGFDSLGIQLPVDLQNRVVRLSQGLPHYTHLLGRELARRAILAERDAVVTGDWPEALKGALMRAEQQVIDLYGDATTTAKPSMFPSLLIACALAKKGEQGFFKPADVHPHLNRIDGKSYAMASFTGNLASLSTQGRGPALQQREFADRRNRYRFANPLLQPYVLIRAISDGRISAKSLDDIEIWA